MICIKTAVTVLLLSFLVTSDLSYFCDRNINQYHTTEYNHTTFTTYTMQSDQLQSLREAALIGFWHGSRAMPAGFAERYIFFNNFEYSFFASQMENFNRERAHSGNWRIVGDTLELSISQKQILVGGEESFCPIRGNFWYGAIKETVTVEPSEIRILPLSDVKIAHNIISSQYGNHKITIGERTFWRFNFFADMYEAFIPQQWY